ncbi:MAG: hypothetical protein ABI082_04720 [Dokdonella sp.]
MPHSVPSYPEFRSRVAQTCSLRCLVDTAIEDAPVLDAVLSDVSERGERSGYEHFSLMFRAEEGTGPRQGMYAVSFADGVRWDVFLVPVERDSARIVYEACFNRGVPA